MHMTQTHLFRNKTYNFVLKTQIGYFFSFNFTLPNVNTDYLVGLERMSELSRVREPWLKFGHEYSPYQSSDSSRIFVFISNNSTLNKINHENNMNLPK